MPPNAEGPSVWTRGEMERDRSWIVEFDARDLAELADATDRLAERGLGPLQFGREDFPLPNLSLKLAALLEDIEYGRGFALLRGLDVERYDIDRLSLLYWGLGAHLGQVISQNSQGDLLGRVTDMESGKFSAGGYYEAGVRGHRTNAFLPPHSDSSDVVGLLCVRPARKGGESWIASSIAV